MGTDTQDVLGVPLPETKKQTKKTPKIMIATKPQPATQRKPFYAANINAPIDNDLMSIEELVAKLNRGSQAIKEGKGIALRTKEESRSYLLSL